MDIFGPGATATPNVVINSGGTIQADVASTVSIRDGVKISGGVLQGAGTIEANGSNIVLENLSNRDLISISDGSVAKFEGTINNTGRIVINSMGNTTTMDSFAANFTGGGSVELVGNDALLTSSVSSFAGLSDTLFSDNTILGEGQIIQQVQTNTGTIASAGQGNTLTVGASRTINANGILEARTGSTLLLTSGFQGIRHDIQNQNGITKALDGGTVQLGEVDIEGGVLRTHGTGKFVTLGGSSQPRPTLKNTTLDGLYELNNGESLKMSIR